MSADDPELSVRLPQSVWMTAIESLAQRPYAEVSTVIETIAEQLGQQIRETNAQAQPTETRPN